MGAMEEVSEWRKRSTSGSLGLGLCGSFRAGQSSSCVDLGDAFQFEHQRRVQFEGSVAEPLQTITAFFFGLNEAVCCELSFKTVEAR